MPLGLSAEGGEGRGTPPGPWNVHPSEFGSESLGPRMDVDSGQDMVWADAGRGAHKCRFTKAIEKGLGGKRREYLQLKYWSDYIICGALQANLFAAFSICHSVSMVSRLVRDGIFKPNRQSLNLKTQMVVELFCSTDWWKDDPVGSGDH